MLRRILGCFVTATLFWQLWPPSVSQAQTAPTLFIGEVAWAGSPLSNADEWLEIWNISNERVSLAGYWLDGVGPAEGMLFDETSFVEAHSAFVIANYSNEHENAGVSDEAKNEQFILIPNENIIGMIDHETFNK